MSLNESLRRAKRQRNDEFYTQRSDIENELRHYTQGGFVLHGFLNPPNEITAGLDILPAL